MCRTSNSPSKTGGWILQSRSAKRTPRAALKVAVDFVHEGLLSPREALRREPARSGTLAVAHFAGKATPVSRGIGAAGGVAAGRATFDAAAAERLASAGEPLILVRPDIDTSDVAGLAVRQALSRRWVDARPCRDRAADGKGVRRQLCFVAGGRRREAGQMAGRRSQEGDWISIDGDTGEVFLGQREILTGGRSSTGGNRNLACPRSAWR